MKTLAYTLGFALIIATAADATAQFPTASKEHQILKMEEGVWDAEITMYMGPAGAYNPPQKSKGKESNRMIGDFWLISDFEGSFEGMAFKGHGQFGFDPAKKKYTGTWVDSFSSNTTKMSGTYDADKKTMTYETTGVEMDGSPSKGRNVVVYGDKKRVMTMYSAAPDSGEMIKVMEITYTKTK
ncbi:MAG: DUF1579 domain-containing protein [Planctomycetota bacterium]